MLGENKTPFAAIAFEQFHRDGDHMAVIAMRGSFTLTPESNAPRADETGNRKGPFVRCHVAVADKQAMVLADEYDGTRESGALMKVSDLIPFKPATDITLVGRGYAPDQTMREWPFGITVDGVTHTLHCRGDRSWLCCERSRRNAHLAAAVDRNYALDWHLGEAKPLSSVPLDYAYASGGEIIGAPKFEADQRNPRGRGVIHRDYIPTGQTILAPVIDSNSEQVTNAFSAPEPQGTAPIPPEWLWRRRYAGTYDDKWRQTRAPFLPQDFDYRFFQSAHPELIVSLGVQTLAFRRREGV